MTDESIGASADELALPRLGLCCAFDSEPTLKFRTTTVAHLSRLMLADSSGATALAFYSQLVHDNLDTLVGVMSWCIANSVHAFRMSSDLWPRATHPLVAPFVNALFDDAAVVAKCTRIREEAAAHDIRLSEHPDQFLVGNSLRADVVAGTIVDLEWRGRLGARLGVDVICLHIGSGAPDRESALWRWDSTLALLSPAVLSRLAFENDDRTFSPEHVLPASLAWGIPTVYDVHHHRAHPDSLDEIEATELAMASWGDREPYFHMSSPRSGWSAGDVRPHHDVIELDDWPPVWTMLARGGVRFTVDIEARGKERAIFSLRHALQTQPRISH
ncbi:MAG TPA: hypothetical protein VE869_02340 [Gemmatimonas sp.]|nr:hypothetical protein [Gemmatimonas sp.]